MSAATTALHGQQERNQEMDREQARWRPAMSLPCLLTVELKFPGFHVADYLALHAGSIVSARWGVARDVPVRVNGVVVGWAELEGVGHRLAVRLTELA